MHTIRPKADILHIRTVPYRRYRYYSSLQAPEPRKEKSSDLDPRELYFVEGRREGVVCITDSEFGSFECESPH